MNEREREPFSEITGLALILFGAITIVLSIAGGVTDPKLSNGPWITGIGGAISVTTGGLTWKFGRNIDLSGVFNF